MYTLGHNFAPAHIHAGGLRYHGAGSIVSQLKTDGYLEAVDIPQLESFEAGVLFAQTEGFLPAPESAHAIAATIREAKKAKEEGTKKTILFNLSGHGMVDMTAYDQFIAGDLVNFELSDKDIEKTTEQLEHIIQ
jgi:tryptophan synthase beta chain